MNHISLLFSLLIFSFTGIAQSVTNYIFTSGTTTFTQLSGGANATLNGNTDDGFYTGIPIGFNFIYNSTVYTTLSASTNGFISLGSNISNANSQANNLATGTGTTSPRPIIAPLWDDNEMSTANGFSYQTSGTAPNRVFTAEWLNIQWNYNATAGCLSMQVKLYEANSRVEFIYRPEAGALVTPSASLGITNILTGPRNFLCLTSVSGLPFDTSTVTETTTINTKPNNGQRFTFSPQFATPVAPSALNYSAISPMSMNVSWVDNATTETYYQLFISSDAVNYNLHTTVNSTTRTTTGTNYSASVAGLTPGVTYYYRLFVCNEGSLPTSFVAGTQATLSGLLSGVKTVCPTGCDYPAITNALTDIRNLGVNGNFILELDATYDPTLETFPLGFGNLQTTAANTVTIRPRNNVTSPVVFTGFGTSTFDLNNTRFLTIDGRRGGSGSGGFLQITNLTGSGTAVSFTNNSSNNTFRDCIITGATSSLTSGVIVFGSSTAGAGNNSNTIINCIIKDSIATPIQCIYSAGSAAFPNQNNIIQSNRIINFYNGSNANFGVNLAAASENWTISANSFYQETSRSLSFNSATAIAIASGAGHTIQNNFFGGSLPLCAGAPLNYTGDGTLSMISISTAVSDTVQIIGNTIANINLELNNSAHNLINLTNGTFNVINNVIGSTTQTSNIRLFTNATGTIFSAIALGGGSNYGDAIISGNQIGGVTVNGGGTAAIRGINITASTSQLDVANNYLGSPSVSNSIVDSTFADVSGIFLQVTSTNNNITGNTISNLTAASNSSSNRTTGIFAQGSGAYNINNNTIRRLVTNGTNTGTANLAHLHGILVVASGSGLSCNNNIIDGLVSLNPFLTLAINGIYFNTTGTGNSLSANVIKSIFPASSGTCTITGIFNATSATSAYNNMVRLGVDTAGSDMNTNHNIIGIQDAGNSNAYIHNSVYIGGASVGGASASNTAAFFNSTFSSGTRIIVNNIFTNVRSNSTATSKHYCLFLTTTNINGLTINNNLYFAPGNGGTLVRYNAADINSMSAWRAIANFDINSGNGNPNFVAPQAANASMSLGLGATTPAEGTGLIGMPVTIDSEGQSRAALTPVDIGADAGNYQTVDIFASIITHTQVGNTSTFTNRTITAVITDIGTGVRNSGSLQPRLWYRRTFPSATAWVSSGGVLTSGTINNGTWSFTLDYALIPGIPSINNQYQYYIVVQDSASPVNVAILPFAGAAHSDVNTQITAPTTPFSYSLVGSLPVSISVGAGQTYTSLTGAGGLFNAINNGALSGNTVVTIVSDITETGANILNNAGLGGFNLLIRPDNQLRTLSGSFTLGGNGLIHLNGAAGVTIDGGPNRNLLIRNISGTTPSGLTAPTVWIINGVNDTIRNCVIEGNNSNSFYAAVTITTSTAGALSSGIVLLNNVIRGAVLNAANSPASGITVSGAANNIQNLTIQANTIFDFSAYGIVLSVTGNNALIGHPTDTSLGNNIYQRASRGAQSFIAVFSGTGHVIGSNKLFNSPGILHSGSSNGIWVASSINGIIITNNSIGGCNTNRGNGYFQTSGTWFAINVTAGTSIGSSITSNRIGNTTAANFYGINIAGGMVNLLNNQIGGVQDTIIANGIVNGITSSSSSTIQINTNSISHLVNTGVSTTQGISISSGTNTITGNTIQSVFTTTTTQTAPDFACTGIRISTTTSGNIVNGNTISTLINTSSTLGTSVAGISVNNSWTGSEVYANRIYGLDATNTASGGNSAVIYGIYVGSSGSATFHNNQVSIAPPTVNNQTRIRGIELNTSGGVNEFYYNTIFIGGTANGINTTSAFFRNTTSSTVALILGNNILYNQRTSSSQTHYALSSVFFGSFTHNNNLYVGGNTNLIENPIGNSRTLASWNSLTGNPTNNLGNLTSELPAAQFFTSIATGNLSTNACRVSNAGSVVSVTTDFNNNSRSSTPDIGSVEFTTPTGSPVITTQPAVPAAVCAGAGTRILTTSATGYGISFQWQIELGGLWSNLINGTNYSGVTSSSLSIINPPISFNGNRYRCLITAACLPVLASDSVILSVNDLAAITAQPLASTICSGNNSRFIVAATGSGLSYQWQLNTGSGWNNITVSPTYPNVSDDTLNVLNASALFNGYLYRCVITGSCNSVNSNQAQLTVNSSPLITAQPVNITNCTGGSALFTVTATGGGLTYQWQENQGFSWNNLSDNATYVGTTGASLTINNILVSMSGYQYRCVVSGICSPVINSNAATLIVNVLSVGGSVSGGTTICSGATSGTLTLSGNTGSVVRWESSVAPFTTWTTISNTATTYTSGALTQTTQFRAVVQSGTCPEANSTTTTVTVSPTSVGGSVSGGAGICTGSTSGTLTLSGNTGSVVRWESSVAPFTTWTTISNTATTYTSGVLTQTTQFRAVVQSGTCPEVTSTTATVTVSSPTVRGSISGSTPVCSGTTSNLTLSGQTGSVVRWESATAPYSSWSAISNTTTSLTTSAITQPTAFRAVVQSGSCAQLNTDSFVVNVISSGVWLGLVNSNWNNASNWCGGIPTTSSDVVINSGAPNAPSINTAATVNNLTINSGGSLSFSGTGNSIDIRGTLTQTGSFNKSNGTVIFGGLSAQNIPSDTYTNLTISGGSTKTPSGVITVNGTLSLSSGYIALGSQSLVVGSAGSITGASATSFVIINGTGRLTQNNIGTGGRTGSIQFPVGTTTTSYTPVSINNSGTADDIAVGVINGAYPGYTGQTPTGIAYSSNVVDKTWFISEATAGGSNASVTFQWNGTDELSMNRSNMLAGRYSTSWNSIATGSATGSGPYTFTANNVSTFGTFGLGDNNSSLPVSFISFTGAKLGKDAILNWSTAQEINNSHFEVERSLDGITFKAIGKVTGRGNTSEEQQYSYTDANIFAANRMVYYRLKQVDFDGTTAYTSVVAVMSDQAAVFEVLQVSPNPFISGFTVGLIVPTQQVIKVELTDAFGKLISTQEINPELGMNNLEINESELKAGMYIVRITQGEISKHIRVVKQQ